MPANLFSLVRDMATPRACSDIIELAKDFPPQDAETFSGKTPEARESVIRWLDRSEETEELFRAFEKACHSINEKNFGIDVDFSALEKFQYTEYGPEQHYSAHHQDCGFRGGMRQRKLSFSLMLSGLEDFEGGDFRIGSKTLRMPKGCMIVFPSIVYHSVGVVTRGLRQSLVGWYEGPSWR